MKRNIAKLTSRKFVAVLVTTGTGLFSLGSTAIAQDVPPAPKIPAIVLRPASEQVNDCEIELDRLPGSDGYRLRINIPDSVSTVEVTPSPGSGRSFRIRMEDSPSSMPSCGTPATNAIQPRDRGADLQLRAPKDVMASVSWQRFDTGSPTYTGRTSTQSKLANAQTTTRPAGLNYISNPFFAPTKFAPVQKVEASFAAEQLEDTPQQSIERNIRSEPVRLEEIANIKTASLEADSNTIDASVATASLTASESNLDSISVGPIAIEIFEPTADFQPLTSPAPSLNDAGAPPKVTDEPALDNPAVEKDAFVDLTTIALPQLPSNNRFGHSLPITVTPGGPESVSTNGENDYWITVTNESQIGIEDLNLSLTTPEGMDVTVLEQPADFDETTRTLTWSLPRIEAGSQTVLRYKSSTKTQGQFQQNIILRQGKSVSTSIESMVESTKQVTTQNAKQRRRRFDQ